MKSFTSTLWAALCLMFPMGAAADNYIHFKTPTTYKFRVTFTDKNRRPTASVAPKSSSRKRRWNAASA